MPAGDRGQKVGVKIVAHDRERGLRIDKHAVCKQATALSQIFRQSFRGYTLAGGAPWKLAFPKPRPCLQVAVNKRSSFGLGFFVHRSSVRLARASLSVWL